MNSVNRGGVEVPRLYQVSENDYCLFENLKMFCQHGWHFGFIFDERELTKGRYVVDDSQNVLPCDPMIYLLASSLWEYNLRYLDQQIKRISFKEIRNPKLEINLELHDRREDLAHIRRGLVETKMYIPPSVARFFSEHPRRPYSSRIQADNWNRLLEECTRLEAFLMETFQLFMSSVSVQDSRLSINQSRRGSQLTLLALIYVPLSFVTGIFGMNIQQVNGSGLNLWVCFVTLVPVILVTILVFLAVKIYGDRKEAGENSSYSSKV
ncbi:cora-like Mg2+ transporter protein-domain-containing protein [Leptodontidium sp. MPI-SDFR-AT-0119]|nr:cora-like Mg2+ transporter protein-domain-containing protein [Leptodontidium sp. MPI-SDFR-AT-0119]